MKTVMLAALALTAALGACSDKAQNEASQAANAIGSDVQSEIGRASCRERVCHNV